MSGHLHSVTVRRWIKSDRIRVFEAFSSAEALSQWFSPSADISVEVLEFDFIVGGHYRLRYKMPDGSPFTTVISIVVGVYGSNPGGSGGNSIYGGAGGDGGFGSSGGNAGIVPGGGGGGHGHGSTAKNGGAGAAGKCIVITW